MCGSPSVDNSAQKAQQDAADQARREEDLRIQKVDFGLNSINSIFDGGERFNTFEDFLLGTNQTNPVTDFATQQDRDAQVQAARTRASGTTTRRVADQKNGGFRDREVQNTFIAPTFEDPNAGGPAPVAQTTATPGFGGLIDDRRQAQLDFQLPQLQDRFGDSRDDLAFNLSRAGLSNSSVAGNRQADLGSAFQLEDAKLRGGVENDIASLRSRIAGSRSALEADLRASSDPSSAINAALSSSQRFFQEPAPLNSVGDIFAGLVGNVGQAVNLQQSNSLTNRLNDVLASGASQSGSGSGRVVS